jgi:hypothetical protein
LLAALAADRALNPPTSSSLAEERERLCVLLLRSAARDPMFNLLAPRLIARSARGGSRSEPAAFLNLLAWEEVEVKPSSHVAATEDQQ